MEIPLFTISGADLMGSLPGEAEKNLTSIFEEAEYLGKEIKGTVNIRAGGCGAVLILKQ